MGHIIKYSPKREKEINNNYSAEYKKAINLPIGFEQTTGYELLETDFTNKELAEIDKMVRETLGKDYKVVYCKKARLCDADCKQSYITYGIIHKELFKRSKARYDKASKSFFSSDENRIITRNPADGTYFSTYGYTWFTFKKNSNDNTIRYKSDEGETLDGETFGRKAKYKKTWEKLGNTFLVEHILFNKFLRDTKQGIETTKNWFNSFL